MPKSSLSHLSNKHYSFTITDTPCCFTLLFLELHMLLSLSFDISYKTQLRCHHIIWEAFLDTFPQWIRYSFSGLLSHLQLKS